MTESGTEAGGPGAMPNHVRRDYALTEATRLIEEVAALAAGWLADRNGQTITADMAGEIERHLLGADRNGQYDAFRRLRDAQGERVRKGVRVHRV